MVASSRPDAPLPSDGPFGLELGTFVPARLSGRSVPSNPKVLRSSTKEVHMSIQLADKVTSPTSNGSHEPQSTDVVHLPRRCTLDRLLIAVGAVLTIVLATAGGLLTWGSNFAEDYVTDELSSQNIFFPDQASLEEQGRTDLVKYAEEQVTTGEEAEAYASFIDGHLAETAGGMTYAELGGPVRAAEGELEAAVETGESDETIADLQAEVDTLNGQRDSLFRGETLRGLLLSTFAWSTIGRIAGIAATVAFVAAGLMVVLVVMGLVHRWRVRNATTG